MCHDRSTPRLFLLLGNALLSGGLRLLLGRGSLVLGLSAIMLGRGSLLLGFGSFLRQGGCGELLPVEGDFGNAHRSERLTMSVQLLVLFLAFVMEDEDLVAAAFLDHRSHHSRFRLRTANLAFLCGNCEHVAKLYVASRFMLGRAGQFLNPNDIAGRN